MTDNHNDHELDTLVDFLRRNRGFDFTGYKSATITRRIARRMQAVEIGKITDYIDYLEVHPEEFTQLFNTILINVTSFFRDPHAWDFVFNDIVPQLVKKRQGETPIRIWSAGCASGEEPYSIAMLLAEAMDRDQFNKQVKIYATDLDEEALDKARIAVYSDREVESVPMNLLEKYFDRVGSSYAFNKDIRRAVIFGRHDLIQDAPISHIDLLICRNLLMYFNVDTQSRVLARLNFSLNPEGLLFLGRAEMILSHSNLFVSFDLKHRIFTPVAKPNLRDRLMIMAQGDSDDSMNNLANQVQLRNAAFNASPVAQVVLDGNGLLNMANVRACSFFDIRAKDIGKPFSDLEVSYRPAELRSTIDRVNAENNQVLLKAVEWIRLGGEVHYLDILVTPFSNPNGGSPAVIITFQDVTAQVGLQNKLEHSNQELETAMEELQSTNEELETTNEELQSTIEELETTNEELQSTNEELETMNEELQSTNEELEALNNELQIRTDNLHTVNRFMESILTSLRGGVVVVDENSRVLVWNRKSEDLWGLRQDEAIGKNFLAMDIGLPVLEIKQVLRQVTDGNSGHREMHLQATNRRGKLIECQVSVLPLQGIKGNVEGAVILVEDGVSGE
jgi:two-component system, chemotaxis family, CheB/CheR fusion protein